MAFPLDIHTELLIDGAWQDVSGDVYNREALRISHGRADEGGRADVSKATFLLNNRGGKYSPRNPRSPLFGKIGRNTPVRISIDGGESYLETDGAPANIASTPHNAAFHPTTSLDLRAEVSPDNWRLRGGNQTLIGKWEPTGNQCSYMMRVSYDPSTGNHNLSMLWSTDGTPGGMRQVFASIGWPMPRYAVRWVLAQATGTATMYMARTLDGPWQEITSVSTGVAEPIFNSSAPLEIAPGDTTSEPDRVPFAGRGHRFAVVINGAEVASPDFRHLAPGITSFTDSKARTWALSGTARIANRHTRFEGEIASWPSRWEPSGTDAWVPVQAAGIRRRLSQGVKALDSTLRRRIPSGNPIAYWPLEEGAGATQGYSPIPNVKPLRVIGAEFAADDSLGGSSALPKFTGTTGQFTADVPPSRKLGWHVEMPFFIPAITATEREFFRVRVAGAGTVGATSNNTVAAVAALVSTAGVKVAALNDDSEILGHFLLTTAGAVTAFVGKWNRLQLFTTTDGGTSYLNLRWVDIVNGGFWHARTVMTGSPGRVTQVRCNAGPNIPDVSLGHLAVFDTAGTVAAGGAVNTTTPGTTIYAGADDGFINEAVCARMERICDEEGIAHRISAIQGVFTMGPQRPRTVLEILDECADVDQGMVFDARDKRAIAYRGRGDLYNQTPAMTLDYAGGQREVAVPFEPVEDDQNLRNDVTRVRSGGAEFRAVLEDGPLSIQPPPLGVGTYDESVEINPYSDTQLRDITGWALHLGTWDEARFPVVNMRLHGAPHLVDAWLGLELLDRIDVVNPPEYLPAGDVRLMVQGYEEELTLTTWDVTLNCSPYGPYDVAVVDDPDLGRADTSGSVVTVDTPATSPTIPVTTLVGPPWVTGNGSDFPFSASVAGEVVTVTSITQDMADSFNRTVTNGWGTASTGQAWVNTGGTTTNYAVSAGTGRHIMATTNLTRTSLVPLAGADVDVQCGMAFSAVPTLADGQLYLEVRSADATHSYLARLRLTPTGVLSLTIRKRDAAETLISDTFTVPGTYVAGTFYNVRFSVIGSELRARVWAEGTAEPAAWQVSATDVRFSAAGLVGVRSNLGAVGNAPITGSFKNFAVLNQQTMHVLRTASGPAKFQVAGGAVGLTHPSFTSY
jgi:hypothetical protein